MTVGERGAGGGGGGSGATEELLDAGSAGQVPALPAPRRHKASEEDLDLSAPVELVALAVKQRAVRCRILGTGREITLRFGHLWDLVPGDPHRAGEKALAPRRPPLPLRRHRGPPPGGGCASLTRLSRLLRILGFHAHDLNLVPSVTVYMRWGKGPKRRLRFTETGDPELEAAYATHFVWPGEGTFHPPTPSLNGCEVLGR